ncbi:MAG: nucleotidyltransferase family protein [Deltaproteobacteria bacterium]
MKPTLVVLAAGMGSRYGGLKQMDAFGPNGETILDFSIYDAINSGFGKVVFIIRQSFLEDFKNFFKGKFEDRIEVEFVTQELEKIPEGYGPFERQKPWGTAHAVQMAKDVTQEPFLVINADDYYGRDAYKVAFEYFNEFPLSKLDDKDIFFVMGYKLKKTLSDHGTVNRGVCEADEYGNLIDIKECKKIGREDDGVIRYPDGDSKQELSEESLVSMNMWGFYPSYFDFFDKNFRVFLKENGENPTSEYYIPDLIDFLIKEGQAVVKVLSSDSEWFGVTYQEDKPFVTTKLQELMDEGFYPPKLWN